jgi:hypothetical protein
MAPRASKTEGPKEVTLVDGDGYEVTTADATSLHNLLGAGFKVKGGDVDAAQATVTRNATASE